MSRQARGPRRLRPALALALALVAAAGCGGSARRHPPPVHTAAPRAPATVPVQPRPNVIFVLTDDLSWNLVQFMPHVEQMRRHGVTFTNYFVTDSLCCPSRASIFSGRFPHNTGVFTNSGPDGGFDAFHSAGGEQDTFATALHAAGYSTGLMGKYLNGYRPRAPVDGADPYVPPGWDEWDVAGNGYPEFGYTLNQNGRAIPYGHAPSDYLTDVISRRGASFVDAAAARHTPFMLELATFAPHQPYTPAPRDAGRFPGLAAPRTPAFDAPTAGAPAWLRNFVPLRPRQLRQIDRAFRRRAQSVLAVDAMIGALEARLAADGLARNTYIVFSSDNGLHMGEHRLMPGKQTAFDTDIRVPLIVTGPGVPAGRTVDALAENIDLAPTFTDLAGTPAPAAVDGHSLAALLHGAHPRGWRRTILVEHHGPNLDPTDPDLPIRGSGNPPSYEALRTRTSTYAEYQNGERELYDLGSDPFELYNRATGFPPSRADSLHSMLATVAGCQGAAACWAAEGGS